MWLEKTHRWQFEFDFMKVLMKLFNYFLYLSQFPQILLEYEVHWNSDFTGTGTCTYVLFTKAERGLACVRYMMHKCWKKRV